MSVEKDFDAATAASLKAEIERFRGQCWYDARCRKIVYASADAAMDAYMTLQREEMEKHRWVESQRACCDLGEASLMEWIKCHSTEFARYWRRTHMFVPNGCCNHNGCGDCE